LPTDQVAERPLVAWQGRNPAIAAAQGALRRLFESACHPPVRRTQADRSFRAPCGKGRRVTTGELSYFYAGPDSAPEEPLLIPRSPDAPEGDGWLISIVGRRAENRTDLVILDALDITAGSVATIRIPFSLHEGFHGTWVTAT
jgi:Retinal pigment epithelial membrane protein